MNLLDYKVDEKKVMLEDWNFFSDQVMGGVSEGKTSLKKDKNKLSKAKNGAGAYYGYLQVTQMVIVILRTKKPVFPFKMAIKLWYTSDIFLRRMTAGKTKPV